VSAHVLAPTSPPLLLCVFLRDELEAFERAHRIATGEEASLPDASASTDAPADATPPDADAAPPEAADDDDASLKRKPDGSPARIE